MAVEKHNQSRLSFWPVALQMDEFYCRLWKDMDDNVFCCLMHRVRDSFYCFLRVLLWSQVRLFISIALPSRLGLPSPYTSFLLSLLFQVKFFIILWCLALCARLGRRQSLVSGFHGGRFFYSPSSRACEPTLGSENPLHMADFGLSIHWGSLFLPIRDIGEWESSLFRTLYSLGFSASGNQEMRHLENSRLLLSCSQDLKTTT